MDIATIIGWLLSIGAVALLIIDQDQLQMFFGSRTAFVSIVFVLGGTVAGTMMRYSMGHFLSSLGVVAKIFTGGNQNPTPAPIQYAQPFLSPSSPHSHTHSPSHSHSQPYPKAFG